jgi:predicted amidophosphoribosyltransferase
LTCSSCGAEAQAGQKFCLQCGTKLTEACPSCGTSVIPGARFCGECGASLASTPATEAHAETTAERRLVSVLFTDLVGFTSLSEFRDPEEIRRSLPSRNRTYGPADMAELRVFEEHHQGWP